MALLASLIHAYVALDSVLQGTRRESYDATQADESYAAQMSGLINVAYSTLRSPFERASYMVSLCLLSVY
jgi:hypothetical protein